MNEANEYAMASRIRSYVAAVERNAAQDNEETIKWIAWAKSKADWYDPTVSSEDPVFGKRDHGADEKNKHPVKKQNWY